MIELSLTQARSLHLAAQGLAVPPRRKARKPDLLAAIERMQLLQIDTIHVVARSPYLVLYSRLGSYPPDWLTDLLAEGALFEVWSHEACFAPMRDWALHDALRHGRDRHWSTRNAQRMRAEQREGMDGILAKVRDGGAVRARDFERSDGKSGGWWEWKPEKRWLEAWFHLGELMVARRESFQRVYDLAERVRTAASERGHVSAAAPRRDALDRELILRAVAALGITAAGWINDYYRHGRKLRDRDLDGLVDAGELLRVTVAGFDAPLYVHPVQRPLLEAAADGTLKARRTVLLSPFDPVVWDRERASVLFGFDYRIECYTPGPKRQFGYFVLPILDGSRLVGRLDAKAHRQGGVFEVKALFLEDGVRVSDALVGRIARAIVDCAAWHGTPEVAIRRCEPASLKKALHAAVKG